MEEFRRHARWCPAGHPPGVYRLDVFTEYAAFPVWERAGMSNPARLGISADLSDNLRAWQDWWEQRTEYGGGMAATDAEWTAWREHGRLLSERLAQETGAAVVYLRPDPPAAGRAPCPTCEHRAR
jgi:hypothetical protein